MFSVDYSRNSYHPRHQKQVRKNSRTFAIIALVLFLAVGVIFYRYKKTVMATKSLDELPIEVNLISLSPYTRSGRALKKVNGIVVHYTANPGATAKENRDYFNSLATTHKTKASCHFIIGLDGEIIQCIPTREMSYASNSRNRDTISIECCHKDASGKFNRKTYRSLVLLTRALMKKFNLSSSQVIRHYDVTGKLCPLYYVKNSDKWDNFREDLNQWSFFDYLYY
jgi:N-acetylmuramoyl-L-alanine amidase CwlA